MPRRRTTELTSRYGSGFDSKGQGEQYIYFGGGERECVILEARVYAICPTFCCCHKGMDAFTCVIFLISCFCHHQHSDILRNSVVAPGDPLNIISRIVASPLRHAHAGVCSRRANKNWLNRDPRTCALRATTPFGSLRAWPKGQACRLGSSG